jgi:hypothetical protein
VYQLYTDYVLKNPFYVIDMPVRCKLFDQHLARLVQLRDEARGGGNSARR